MTIDPMTNRTPGIPISAVERDTGLSKDTLRVWERRYGFPQPERDAQGERAYPPAQVDRLRLLKRLLDLGHRPGKVVPLPPEHLQALIDQHRPQRASAPPGSGARLAPLIALLQSHDVGLLRAELSQTLMRQGLARFVTDTIAPLNEDIGEAWAAGTVQVFQEHLYTEVVQGVLRQAIAALPRGASHPRILLTTLPQEPHALGLLMAEALFALDGCHCISLGVQTPLLEILQATQRQAIDVVALSFSAALNSQQVLDGLAELRARLPQPIEVWAGGACPVLHRRPPAGITTIRLLEEIAGTVQGWRARHHG